jgi:excinuclease ABC subunit C
VILPRTSEALYLLQRVRDEAHRFAITFHRQRRSKRMTASALDSIPGLGETRRTALLRHFGSLKRLGQATPEEIAEVHGIGRRTAEAVLAALNPPPDKPEPDGEAADRPTTIPAGGAGRTRAGARRSRAGLPPVKTSAVRAAVAETAAGASVAGEAAAEGAAMGEAAAEGAAMGEAAAEGAAMGEAAARDEAAGGRAARGEAAGEPAASP